MELLLNLSRLKLGNSVISDRTAAESSAIDNVSATGQRMAPIWPLAQSQKTDWLKLYQAMDTAG